MMYKFEILIILTVGFGLACLLGYFSQRARLSPILGYLLAGYLIGPFSPGYQADLQLAEQLAEIGVVLMMFGVGLHFKVEDLLKVKHIAIPGAIGQTAITATLGTLLVYGLGFSIYAGVIVGLAIGVASTMVLVRVLNENKLLKSPEGRIAVGWTVIEDIFTIFLLILVPILGGFAAGSELAVVDMASSVLQAVIKFLILVLFMFTIGKKCVAYLLSKVVVTNSHELFTLAILALTFLIAAGSAFVFGTSITLGAFIAGMVIGMTDVRHMVSNSATPLRDTFVVIFFLTTGMLFNPAVLISDPLLVLGVFAIIVFVKPLTAYLITVALKNPIKVALTVAVALAQIGEFSFILAEEASRNNLIPDSNYDAIVACAFFSISINPLLFRLTLKE